MLPNITQGQGLGRVVRLHPSNRDHLGALDVDGSIILKWILQKL